MVGRARGIMEGLSITGLASSMVIANYGPAPTNMGTAENRHFYVDLVDRSPTVLWSGNYPVEVGITGY